MSSPNKRPKLTLPPRGGVRRHRRDNGSTSEQNQMTLPPMRTATNSERLTSPSEGGVRGNTGEDATSSSKYQTTTPVSGIELPPRGGVRMSLVQILRKSIGSTWLERAGRSISNSNP